ncbi:uncharacterized protein LOC121948178 isoform X2 [Plectropomus leopardus]|nr:uncharacterized protein LOC121948178 isoform X2 [Plectropomus leopardus]
MDKGEAKDPRLKVSYSSTDLRDLTTKDDGFISISYNDGRLYNIIRLKILDCSKLKTKYYGDTFYLNIPSEAEFLEFTHTDSVDQPNVLWNRSDPQISDGVRGRGKRWEIAKVNQGDGGYYNFRRKDNTLLSRIQLVVKEDHTTISRKLNERLFIQNPSVDVQWTVTFQPEGKDLPKTVMKAGRVVGEDFKRRIRVLGGGIEIDSVESTDAGTFHFRDPQGHLAMTVDVLIANGPIPIYVYIAIAVGIIFALLVCCCCVGKCCCKNGSSKRDQSAVLQNAVYYHDFDQPARSNQSPAPAPDYSYHPLNSLASRDPPAASLEPSMHNPLNIHVRSPQPEVAPLGGQGADPAPSFGSSFLSLDHEPKFDLKMSSVSPLSSDLTLCDVYTSDKLNFL